MTMDSLSPKEERDFVRDMRIGLLFGKWAAPIMITVMLSVLGGTIKTVNYFAAIVDAQSALDGRVSAVEAARLREADKRDREAKEAAARLEQQSSDIAVLMALVRDVRAAVKDLGTTVRRRQ